MTATFLRAWTMVVGVGLVACGARSGLLTGSDERDAAAGGGSTGNDAAQPSCQVRPVKAIEDSTWEIASPSRVNGHAFYEPELGRVAVYGGGPVIESTHYDEPVIGLTLDPPQSQSLTWSPAHAGWQFAASARDEVLGRVFVVGGWIGTSMDSKLTFEVSAVGSDGVTFRNLSQLPIALRSSAAAFDPDEKRLLLFGGIFQGGVYNGTWELYPDAKTPWKELDEVGDPNLGSNSAMVWARGVGFLLLSASSGAEEELGTLHQMRAGSSTWESLQLESSLVGSSAPLFWDSASCTLLWLGTGCWGTPKTIRIQDGFAFVDELPAPVIPRAYASAALDSKRDRLVVHGGYDCNVAGSFETAVAFPLRR